MEPVTRPGISIRPGCPLISGRIWRAQRTAAMPIGMLIKKTNRQPRSATSSPPREGPIARPAEMLMAFIPSAFPRSAGGKTAAISAKGTAIIMPAASPCRARNTTSQPTESRGQDEGRETGEVNLPVSDDIAQPAVKEKKAADGEEVHQGYPLCGLDACTKGIADSGKHDVDNAAVNRT